MSKYHLWPFFCCTFILKPVWPRMALVLHHLKPQLNLLEKY